MNVLGQPAHIGRWLFKILPVSDAALKLLLRLGGGEDCSAGARALPANVSYNRRTEVPGYQEGHGSALHCQKPLIEQSMKVGLK